MEIIQKPTTNRMFGRADHKPEAIVLHIMAGTLAGTDSWFANPVSQASSHYGVGRNGEVHQYVQEKDTAWANGRIVNPSWSLLKPTNINPNWYTLSIEHEGQATSVWTPAMKRASAELVAGMVKRWNIPLDRQHIIGHYQIDSVNRPNCPAVDKKIIDEIIGMAKDINGSAPLTAKQLVMEARAKLDEALKLM